MKDISKRVIYRFCLCLLAKMFLSFKNAIWKIQNYPNRFFSHWQCFVDNAGKILKKLFYFHICVCNNRNLFITYWKDGNKKCTRRNRDQTFTVKFGLKKHQGGDRGDHHEKEHSTFLYNFLNSPK